MAGQELYSTSIVGRRMRERREALGCCGRANIDPPTGQVIVGGKTPIHPYHRESAQSGAAVACRSLAPKPHPTTNFRSSRFTALFAETVKSTPPY